MTGIWLEVDDALAAQIRERATRRGLTPEEYLADLAVRDLGETRGKGANATVRVALERLRAAFENVESGEDSTVTVRRMRDEG